MKTNGIKFSDDTILTTNSVHRVDNSFIAYGQTSTTLSNCDLSPTNVLCYSISGTTYSPFLPDDYTWNSSSKIVTITLTSGFISGATYQVVASY